MMADANAFLPTGTPATTPRAGDAQFIAGLLQATLTAKKVLSIVSLAWDGPQWRAYWVALGLGEQPERVEALAGALALAAGAESCRVARDGGRLLLELANAERDRKALKASRLEGQNAPSAMAVPLGIASGGQVVWADLDDERFAHVAIGGTTGSGKTVLLKWILYRLARQNGVETLRMVMMDPKRFELRDFARLPHLLHPIVSAPLEIAQVLAWMTGEMDRRMDMGQRVPRILVVVEEVADVLSTNRDVAPLLARIAPVGRGVGIHLLVTTQQPGAKSLGEALVNFPARILGRVASATLTYGAAGREKTGAHVLLGRGDFLLLSAGRTLRFQAPFADGREWGQLPKAGSVASLADELPTLAEFADRNVDPRGGRGRRELTAAEYGALQDAIGEGADANAVYQEFGIGYERARRIIGGYREVADGE